MLRYVLALAVSFAAIWGQTGTSRIRGVVTDSTGAVVPGAGVTVTHESTGLQRTMTTNPSGQYGFDAMPLGKYTVSVTGDRGRGVYTTLDGVDVTDPVIPRGELSQVGMNPDALSEYRVITSVAKAEYGRNAGAQVQVVTRSGTNELHGGLFEFNR